MTSPNPPPRRTTGPSLPFIPGDLVGGRYEVQDLVGRGGSGAVYRVLDRRTNGELALKVRGARPVETRLTDLSVGDDLAWRFSLRQEFYVMSGLRHPNIVHVHDWGEQQGHLYYTMDYIPGRDAADLGLVSPSDVGDLLAALGSALAFVHARGFLHHDVKPRNLRIPAWARGPRPMALAVLMDFGLLSPLGSRAPVLSSLVGDGREQTARARAFFGTPGYVAPEVVLGGTADARADLYAAGATAHVLLTGELPPWRGYTGAPSLPQHVPAPLVELLGELLASDPARRPADAAELLERLAELTPATGSTVRSAPAYLASPPLSGRDGELERLRRAFTSASQGRGGTVYVRGGLGQGKSRLLEALALEARVLGAEVLRADAAEGADTERSPLRVLRALFAPVARKRLGPLGAVLAALPPAGAGAGPEDPRSRFGLPLEEAQRAHQALLGWANAAAAERPVLIVVDDLHACDDASLAALERLGREARRLRLLLLASLAGEPGEHTVAARLARTALDVLDLTPLQPEGTAALVRGLFGRAELPAELLADVHSASGGSPALALEIARALVERGLATFTGGRWRLPRSLARLELPATLDAALAGRLAGLSADGHKVVEALAVAGGTEELGLLADALGLPERQLFAALDELGRAQVAATHRGRTRLAHPRLGELVIAATPEARRRELHQHLGEHWLRRVNGARRRGEPVVAAWLERAGRHLARAGERFAALAAELLFEAGDRAFQAGQLGDALEPLALAAELLEKAGEGEPLPLIWERLGMTAAPYDVELALATFEKLRRHLDAHGHFGAVPDRAARVGSRLAVLGGVLGATAHHLSAGPGAGRRPSSRRGGLLGSALAAVRTALDELERYALATSYVSFSKMLVGELEEARETAELLYRFTEARGGSALAFAQLARAGWAIGSGHFVEVEPLLADALQRLGRAQDMPDPVRRRSVAVGVVSRAWSLALSGSPDRQGIFSKVAPAAAGIDEGLALQTLAIPAVYHANRGEITLMLEARARFLEHCSQLRGNWHESMVYPTVTRALIAAGHIARARDDLHDFASISPAGPFREAWLAMLTGLLAAATGDSGAALEQLGRALRISDRPRIEAELWAVDALLAQGDVWLSQGCLAEASDCARAALERAAAPRVRHLWALARARRLRAQVALLRSDLWVARTEADHAEQLALRLEHPGEQAQVLLLRARIDLASRLPLRARALAAEAEARWAELGNALWAQRAAELRTRAEAAQDPAGANGGDDSQGLEQVDGASSPFLDEDSSSGLSADTVRDPTVPMRRRPGLP